MKLNHNKLNEILVFVLLLVSVENRTSREATPVIYSVRAGIDPRLFPRELLQSKKGEVATHACVGISLFQWLTLSS